MLEDRFYEGIRQANEQLPQDAFLQFTTSCQFGHFVGVQPEVSNPVSTFTLALDWVSQSALLPESTDFDLAANCFDQLIDFAR